MALRRSEGSWLGFIQQVSTSQMLPPNDETQPPSQPFDADDVPIRQPMNPRQLMAPAAIPPPPMPQQAMPQQPICQPAMPQPALPQPAMPQQLMTLEELLVAPGRSGLPKLDPKRENGAGWFEYTKGITKSVKKIMENDFPDAAPNWTSLPGDTKLRWFKAFAQKFNWDFCHTTHVREEFEALCASRMLDRVYDWKVLWRKGEEKPAWMKETVWAGLIVYWSAEKNVKRSITNSINRNSQRGGYGISKHTCGSCPYLRMRENMRDKVTGELPDIVSFMEKTHKRKRDGVFVDKKAEEIARNCRQHEQFKLTQMSEGQDTCADTDEFELTHSEKNEIYLSEVEIHNGRRFGYGKMEVPAATLPSNGDVNPDFKSLYVETQQKLVEATGQIEELNSQVKDAVFWSNLMRDMYPNHVPPSQSGENNNSR